MSRQPIQVLVIPFRRTDKTYEFGIFKRSDANCWQFIAGGVEGSESVEKAASREAFEEAGISLSSDLITLDSRCCVPADIFKEWKSWPAGTYIVHEFAFAIEVLSKELNLSDEHLEFKWCNYDESQNLLKWDSNKTALWELSQRLKKV